MNTRDAIHQLSDVLDERLKLPSYLGIRAGGHISSLITMYA